LNEELEGFEGQNGEPPTPETPPTPPVQQETEDYKHKYESAQGRLEKMNEALKGQGVAFDPSTGAFVQTAQQYNNYTPPATQQQYAPAETAAPSIFEVEDPDAEIQRRIQAGVAQGVQQFTQQFMSQMMPTLAPSIEQGIASQYGDWNEIKGDVLDFAARTAGRPVQVTELTGNPAALEALIYAARGKRASTPAAPAAAPATPPASEAARQAALTQVAGIGGSIAGGNINTGEFDAEELEFMKRRNMTPEQYMDFIGGPAVIRKGGSK
jgi:hypothetical protein